MPENQDDVKDDGNVMPSISEDTPLPGQPEPGREPASSEAPSADENQPEDKTVPLAALHEERTRRQELQAELEVLKQIAGDQVLFDMHGKPVPATPKANAQSNEPRGSGAEELEKLWEDDPRKAVQVEIMAAMSYRDHQEAQVDNQIMMASTKYPDFNQYDQTVRQYIRSLPLEQRARPGVVDLAYYVVKGQNTNNAVEQAKQEVLRKIQAGEHVQGLQPGTTPPSPQPQKQVLNEEQMKVAEAMGLTPEQYMSAMKVPK